MLKIEMVELDRTSTSVRLLVKHAASGCKVALEDDLLVVSCDEPDMERAQDLGFGYSKFSKGRIFFSLKYILIAHN